MLMKPKNLILTAFVALAFFSFTKQDVPQVATEEIPTLRKINHNAFKAGEQLEYRLHYGVINAGTAKLEVKKLDQKIIFSPGVYFIGPLFSIILNLYFIGHSHTFR